MTLNTLLDKTDAVVSGVYGGLMGSWPGLTILGLYVVIVGYMVIMGKAGDKSKEWAVSAFLLTVLASIAGNYGAFNEWVGGPLLAIAQNGGSLAASGGEAAGAGGISGVLDTAENNLGKIMATIDELEVPGNFITATWLYMKVGVVVAIMSILACAMYLAMVALISIALFSLMMMFLVAGPCIWLGSFKETRFVTWAWLRASANYTLWVVFLAGVSGVGNKFISGVADALRAWDLEAHGVFTQEVGAAMLLTALTTYMLLKAADWAAAITGGTATQTGIVGAAGGAIGGAVGGMIQGGMKSVGGMAGQLASKAGGAAARGAAGLAVRAFSQLRGMGR